jgi:anti-anti-sigma regulatory factor
MLKITTTLDCHGKRVLRLEGKLLASWVSELLTACREVNSTTEFELDLAGLSFADSAGIETLRVLADQGLRITNCSPFMAELMGRKTNDRMC